MEVREGDVKKEVGRVVPVWSIMVGQVTLDAGEIEGRGAITRRP